MRAEPGAGAREEAEQVRVAVAPEGGDAVPLRQALREQRRTLQGRLPAEGAVVLTPEQAAELGLREGEVLPVTIAPHEAETEGNPFTRWIGTLPPLPDGEESARFYRRLRDGE